MQTTIAETNMDLEYDCEGGCAVAELDVKKAIEANRRAAIDFARCLYLDGRYIDCLPEDPRALAEAYGLELPDDLAEWMQREDPRAVLDVLENLAMPGYLDGGDIMIPRADFGCLTVAVVVIAGTVAVDVVAMHLTDEETMVIDASEEAHLKL